MRETLVSILPDYFIIVLRLSRKDNMERVVKIFNIDKDFVSCVNCQVNYNCADVMKLPEGAPTPKEMRTFCQEYSINVCPEDDVKNNERALGCNFWFPTKMMRSKMDTGSEEHKRWYEDDSL